MVESISWYSLFVGFDDNGSEVLVAVVLLVFEMLLANVSDEDLY